MTTVEEAIDVLNQIHAADPSVLPKLINYRVMCNGNLALHPTVQVGHINNDPYRAHEVGLLGIINGLFGTDDQSWGFICAIYDDEHKLTGFGLTPPRSKNPRNEKETPA